MHRLVLITLVTLAAAGLLTCTDGSGDTPLEVGSITRAYGEPESGFPTWYERFIHVMTNRARADPPTDLAPCAGCPTSSNCCADAVCFTSALPPMERLQALSRASRFHAANLTHTGCGMLHDSPCQLVTNIDSLYPGSCDGEASCACQGGTATCSGGTTTWARLALFGVSGNLRAENIAWFGDPMSVFYAWLRETSTSAACTWSMDNGHRFNILGGYNKIGVGGQGSYTVQDFWSSGGLTEKIPAGAHYPETSNNSSVELRANWYDTAGPVSALVNIDGTCYPMTQERGMTAANATLLFTTTLSSACHRYYFIIEDSANQKHYYPDTGAFGINCTSDWDSTAPAEGTGCSCTPNCTTAECGDDGCGGSCGSCTAPETCQSGQCICTPTCGAAVCGDNGCGGSCGSCAANELCTGGQCVCQPDCTGTECGDDGCGGTCGNCTAPDVCQAGQCVCQPDCTGAVCGPDGCGDSCGSCTTGEFCQAGQCVASCSVGLTLCGTDCVDLLTDHAHCGGCSSPCAANEACQGGSCVCQPNCTGMVCGDDGCGGSCGACAGNELCTNGQCICQPDCTDAECGDNGCGGTCGTCTGGEVCQDGQCTASCDPGYELCDTDCVDTQTSTQHCGGCDQPCDAGDFCENGQCTYVIGGDAGVSPDGGTDTDAGITPDASPDSSAPKSGCGCQTGETSSGPGPGSGSGSGPGPGGLAGFLLLLLVLGRRFRRRS